MWKSKKLYKRLIAGALCFTTLCQSGITALAADETYNVNFALNKSVTASAAYGTMPASNLTDEDTTSRWSTEAAPTQWAYVDLGESKTVNYYSIIWESETVYGADYNIYVSDNINNWGEPVVSKKGSTGKEASDVSEKTTGRYVKLEVTKMNGYPSVSARDFKVMLVDQEAPQDPNENVAFKKLAVASSIEAESVKAANAVDGDTSSRSSRWGSAAKDAPHWIYVDLEKTMDVKTVKIFWEQRKPTAYRIQVANTTGVPQEADWKDVRVFNDRPSVKEESIVLDKVERARYVRLYIDSATAADPDGGTEWNAISIFELEVYGGVPTESIGTLLDKISVTQPNKETKKLEIKIPDSKAYDITYNGTDYEQVIGEDLTIYKPIVDTKVKVSFKAVNKNNPKDYQFREVEVTVPGLYSKAANDNSAPSILPELREWKGGTGKYTITKDTKIVYNDASLKDAARELSEDYLDMKGIKLEYVQGSSAVADVKDIYLSLTADKSKGLGDEGYLMTITEDKITVEAETTTGAYWSTRTILQSIKLTNDVPCGITRDYPLYKVRGFILDVGRKTFELDYLQQFVKQMAWYKMNDFQIHLNDNLIPLEDYTRVGKDPMEAYSAFRLESDVKEGGNNGLNKADLTSKDVFYTKDEFKALIQDSRKLGVNIVPEIDTPAHSLALTKVRPDLRLGLSGRENDHLNLTTKYDESFSFVKSIFDEYLTGSDPVFDEGTIVHVGADEYNANKEAYRKFSDDLLGYVQGTGRTARIWGSLSQSRGTTPVRSKDVQINLWNFGYANMDEMYELGYDLINCNDGNYYIVPAAGYYYDYLYKGTMYNLAINSIGGVTIPAGDAQMLGGAFAVWNDMTDYLENGMTEYDIYHRSNDSLGLFAAKLWGKGSMTLEQADAKAATLGDAPNTNFGYEVETEDGKILHETFNSEVKGVNAGAEEVDGKEALKLNGNESYVTTDLTTVGLGNDLRVKVKRTSDSTEEQILFESSYGSIKAVQKETGKVGFSRENHDFSFNYTLPVNEWVELEFKNAKDVTQLFVNGELVDILGDNDKTSNEMARLTGNYKTLHATTMFPVERIGSEKNAFVGYVDDVRLGSNDNFASTMELDYSVLILEAVTKNGGNAELKTLVDRAKAVLDKYSPSTEEINTLKDEINAKLADIAYEKADYSRVDAYLALIDSQDLTVFTKESLANLELVKNNIRTGLPIAMQSTVDGYEKALAKAIAALEVKKEININYVDSSRLTATASSYQKDGSDPNKVLDGNTGTMWHTDWNITTMPHWIDLKLDTPTEISGLSYTPRANAGNGTATKYRIEVSTDEGKTYEKVAEGTLKKDATEKHITFEKVKVTNVRFVIVEAQNNNGSASEMKLHLANINADIDGLKAIIHKAKAIDESIYTEASLSVLKGKIVEAEELLNGSAQDANDVEVMKRELTVAMVKLQLKDRAIETVDKSLLEALVANAESLKEDEYTAESWKAFTEALNNAKSALADSTATQVKVEEATTALYDAMEALVKKDVEIVDKKPLEAAINTFNELKSSDYTAESWKVFATALNNAKALLEDKDATQAEVNTAAEALQAAYDQLKKVEPSDNGTTPSKPSKPSNPKTGDITNVAALILLMLLTGGYIAVQLKKKRISKIG